MTGALDAKAVTAALGGRWSGRHGYCRCPAHEDHHASLSIRDGRGGHSLIVYCHARCDWKAIAAALRRRGLWPDRPAGQRQSYKPPPPLRPPVLHPLTAEEQEYAAEVRGEVEADTQPARGRWSRSTCGLGRSRSRSRRTSALSRHGQLPRPAHDRLGPSA